MKIKIKKVNLLHINKKTGVKFATSSFTPHKGKEPVVEKMEDVRSKAMELVTTVLKVEAKNTITSNRSIKSKGGLLEVLTTKGRFYF